MECANCTYYNQATFECRERPPTPVASIQQANYIPPAFPGLPLQITLQTTTYTAQWPKVAPNEWCGRHLDR